MVGPPRPGGTGLPCHGTGWDKVIFDGLWQVAIMKNVREFTNFKVINVI